MCIKNLPPLLCIQLKRFGYDWEANRALKFDDYFKVGKFHWRVAINPIALSMAITLLSFGHSECTRVKKGKSLHGIIMIL